MQTEAFFQDAIKADYRRKEESRGSKKSAALRAAIQFLALTQSGLPAACPKAVVVSETLRAAGTERIP